MIIQYKPSVSSDDHNYNLREKSYKAVIQSEVSYLGVMPSISGQIGVCLMLGVPWCTALNGIYNPGNGLTPK